VLYFGTSGFSYDDWVGPFYPPGMPKREWLSYYAQGFNALELNATYYAIPSSKALLSMARRTGDGFLFAIKAHQEMTHKRQDNGAVFEKFLQAIQPVQESGKLGCILAQFPYSFGYSRQNQDYLVLFRERLDNLPLVVEFRNIHWMKPSVMEWLKREKLGFCCVDEPPLTGLIPPVAEATGPIAYVRFHGRNSAKWWHHEHAYERYDYTYTAEELAEWVPRIKALDRVARQTFVFGNNHYKGQAINTIRQMRSMLD